MSFLRAAAAVLVAATGAIAGDTQRVVLENGATVLLQPVPGVGRVGVEAVYRVGFLDEPAGMTQAAHLIEHLVCMSATAGYGPGESYALLNGRGMANAETLADWTHYDMTADAASLELILSVEAQRLSSLRITPEIIAQEAPRCYAEAAAIDASPKAPLLKFAVMAAHQSWRHGLDRAQLCGGLAEMPIAQITDLHGRHYTPRALTLTIVGDFDPAAAERLCREKIGALPAGPAPAPAPIDWAAVQAEASVRWDCTRSAVILAFPPPEDPGQRLALSVWGSMVSGRLFTDPEVAERASIAMCTNSTWPAGRLPFFFYATVKEGGTPEETLAALRQFVRTQRGAPIGAWEKGRLRMLLQHTAESPALTPEIVKRQAAAIRGTDGKLDPLDLVLGSAALRLAQRELLLADPEAAAAARKVIDESLDELIARTLDPTREHVTVLTPDG